MKRLTTLLAGLALVLFWTAAASALDIPAKFDYLGPEMKKFTNSQGRELIYLDEGAKDWQPVVFFGGWGTSLQAFHLTEFNHSWRENLKLRFISLERNGLGRTPFVEGEGFEQYVQSLRELLDSLGIEKFAVVSISGGGPYLGWTVEAMPERITSVHLAASGTFFDPDSKTMGPLCHTLKEDLAGYAAKIGEWTKNPLVWWDLGGDLSVHKIPGWQDAANAEGAYAFFVRGQMGDAFPAAYERSLYCRPGPEGPGKFTGPVFMYYGTADKSTPPGNADIWKKYFPANPTVVNIYEGEGHDTQYRHWEQVLLDISGQAKDQSLICQGGRSSIVPRAEAEKAVRDGRAIYGSCVWQ